MNTRDAQRTRLDAAGSSAAAASTPTSTSTSKPSASFQHLSNVPSELQSHIADLVGDAGRMLEETRAHASLHQTLTWNQDLQYLCITDLDQIQEIMSMDDDNDDDDDDSSQHIFTHVQHVSICLRRFVERYGAREKLERFMQTVAPNLRTLEVVLGDADHDQCCEFVRVLLSITVRDQPSFDYAISFPKLTSAIVTFSSHPCEPDSFFTMAKIDLRRMDPLYTEDQTTDIHQILSRLVFTQTATWYWLGLTLRQLLVSVPTLAHLSVQVKGLQSDECASDHAFFLLMTCSPPRWRNLSSLRLGGCFNSLLYDHKNSFMGLCHDSTFSIGQNDVWPRLKFYQNLNDWIDYDCMMFHHTFPVLSGLVVRSCDFFMISSDVEAAPAMRFLWLTQQHNYVMLNVLARLYPQLEVMGIIAHAHRKGPVKKQQHMTEVRNIQRHAWPRLRAFYTNVGMTSKMMRTYLAHQGESSRAIVPRIHDLSVEETQDMNTLREQVTRTFLLSRNLSTWSGACNHAQNEAELDPVAYYAVEYDDWDREHQAELSDDESDAEEEEEEEEG
jgi:hypothetical protein